MKDICSFVHLSVSIIKKMESCVSYKLKCLYLLNLFLSIEVLKSVTY